MKPTPQYLLLVAGGTGSRMQSLVPKQFLILKNKPVIIHCIYRFLEFDPLMSIVICVHKEYLNFMNECWEEFGNGKPIQLIEGGKTRFHSVLNGLAIIPPDTNGVVGIHDAARPLVSLETIKRCYQTAAETGNAVPSIEVVDSLRMVKNEENHSVDRTSFRIIQTPQCFRSDLLKEAYKQSYNSIFTDDATVYEKSGHKINLVEGNKENIKLTYLKDLQLAELYLKNDK